ncbi:thymidine phosphorylase [Candidatus Woesearchaeota archaeon]|nr:thymidine phosphorylase [Candidatus Woesearchaeota archaeon]
MKMKVKDIGISSGGPFISIINEKDAIDLDLYALDRIRIKKGKKEIITVVDISTHVKRLSRGHIGLFEEPFQALKLKNNDSVDISIEKKPESVDYIRKKLDNKELSKDEINQIIKDLITNKLTEIELTYFISACYINGLSDNETYYLTKSIVENGKKLKLNKKIVADKHCIGGTLNNRTTLIIVPIVAAAGILIPKTSSRSITSPAGTADTFEALAKVEFPIKKIYSIVKKTNGCIVWTGSYYDKNLAGADDKLIKLRHPLSLDPEGMLLASILAKKAAVNATHILIDIPLGKFTKINNKKQALHLKRKFQKLGKKLKMKIKVIITDGSQPIGNGIGPNLEARDVLYILRRDKKTPKDLEEKSLYMASLILGMAGIKNPLEKAKFILESGLAYKKMKEIIKSQLGNPNISPNRLKLGKYRYNFKAHKNGIIKEISNELLSKIARTAGSPIDKEAGIYLNFHVKDKVKKGDTMFTIYSKNPKKLQFAKIFLKANNLIKIK